MFAKVNGASCYYCVILDYWVQPSNHIQQFLGITTSYALLLYLHVCRTTSNAKISHVLECYEGITGNADDFCFHSHDEAEHDTCLWHFMTIAE